MKGFLLGLVVGAAAFAIGQWLVSSPQLPDPTVSSVPVSQHDAAAEKRVDLVSPQQNVRSAPVSTAPPTAAPGVAAAQFAPLPEPQRPERQVAEPGAPARQTVTQTEATEAAEEARLNAAYNAIVARRESREQAARDAEPKDTWGYSTELQLQQLTSTHSQAAKFEITSIDCRSTFCEVKAAGSNQESILAFQRVMQDAIEQSGGGLLLDVSGSTSNGSSPGSEMTSTMYQRFRKR